VSVIAGHDVNVPLFLYVSFQGVHSPAEVPVRFENANSNITYDVRRKFAGMVTAVDEGIGNVTKALEAASILDESIVIVTSDNGGPIDKTVSTDAIGSSNFPFRGGKHSIWEGGIRAVCFMWAGTHTALRTAPWYGAPFEGMFDAADWLPTLLDASGLNGNGPSPNGLSLDGVSQWGELMDRRVPHARNMTLLNHWDNPTGGDGLRLDSANWRWKLIRGNVAFEGGDNVSFCGYYRVVKLSRSLRFTSES